MKFENAAKRTVGGRWPLVREIAGKVGRPDLLRVSSRAAQTASELHATANGRRSTVGLRRRSSRDSRTISLFPNSVWERTCLGRNAAREGEAELSNSVCLPQNSKQSFTDKCVPKQSSGTRCRTRYGGE